VIPRYTPPRIAAIFADEERLARWLEIELLAVEGWARTGRVPEDAAGDLRAKLGGTTLDAGRVAELEAEQGHDVAAFVSALQETAGEDGRFLHLGLTSSDIVDTALAWQLRDAGRALDDDSRALEAVLEELAVRHRLTLMPGRTHGVHAEPLTLGVKLANHLDEVRRSRERLARAVEEVAVGQLTGPVGTHTSVSPLVEEYVCEALHLGVAPAATQVLARDRHASFVCAIALLGAVLERLATAIRLMQITEVGEVEEPFAKRQKGSSSMPHKRNPVLAERICGMARVLRGHATVALENVALWHERDISHSSAERIVLPDACALVDYMLQLTTRVVRGLHVDAQRMHDNVWHGGGLVFSQRLLGALIDEGGWSRERAYRLVQGLATRAREGEKGFRELVAGDAEVRAVLDEAHLEAVFDETAYTRHIDDTYRRLGLPTTAVPTGDGVVEQPELAVEAGIGGGVLR
jgi:adenylosuccinate lyase